MKARRRMLLRSLASRESNSGRLDQWSARVPFESNDACSSFEVTKESVEWFGLVEHHDVSGAP